MISFYYYSQCLAYSKTFFGLEVEKCKINHTLDKILDCFAEYNV